MLAQTDSAAYTSLVLLCFKEIPGEVLLGISILFDLDKKEQLALPLLQLLTLPS